MCVVAASDKQRTVVITPTQKNPSKHFNNIRRDFERNNKARPNTVFFIWRAYTQIKKPITC